MQIGKIIPSMVESETSPKELNSFPNLESGPY